jgi:hypothetical protein
MISDKQLDEYIAYTRAAFDREQTDISIDTLALQHLCLEVKRLREVKDYMKAGYKADNVFVERLIAAAESN